MSNCCGNCNYNGHQRVDLVANSTTLIFGVLSNTANRALECQTLEVVNNALTRTGLELI